MDIRVGTMFVDLDDKPLPHPDTGAPWTLGLVLLTVALGPAPKGEPYSEDEQAARYHTALQIDAALKQMRGGDIEATAHIPDELLVKLKEDVSRSFAPIIAGQMNIKKMV